MIKTSFHNAQADWQKEKGAPELRSFMKIAESAFTRWLTHDRTTKSIFVAFVPLCRGLQVDSDKGDAVASGLLSEMLTFPFVGTLLYLRDIFPLLARFSLTTQKTSGEVDLSVFSSELPKLIEMLQYMIDNPDDELTLYSKLDDKLAELRKPIEEGGPGLVIKERGGQGAEWLKGSRNQFLRRLIVHLKSRFPEHKLMSSLYMMFDPAAWPADKTALHAFLEPHVDCVLKHYSQDSFSGETNLRVIDNVQEVKDSYMPGSSGVGGLAGVLFTEYRDKTVTTTGTKQPVLPDNHSMAGNKYYVPSEADTELVALLQSFLFLPRVF